MATPESKAKWENEDPVTPYNWAPDLDEDVVSTADHLTKAQDKIGHNWVIEDVQLPDEDPVSLFVQTAVESDPICSSAGCNQYMHKKAPLGYPINYPVPNFGVDADVVATARSIEIGEEAHAHKLIMATPESRAKWHNVAKDTLYNYAPDLDEDMVNTADHLVKAQDFLGHNWVIPDA